MFQSGFLLIHGAFSGTELHMKSRSVGASQTSAGLNSSIHRHSKPHPRLLVDAYRWPVDKTRGAKYTSVNESPITRIVDPPDSPNAYLAAADGCRPYSVRSPLEIDKYSVSSANFVSTSST